LLGTDVGVVFGLLATGALYLLFRAFAVQGKRPVALQIVVVMVALGVVFAITFPSYFNSDLGLLIEDHARERETQNQLGEIVKEDGRFADLDVECDFTRGHSTRVRGTIQSEHDLLDFRRRVFQDCPHVRSRLLFWKLTVTDTGAIFDGCDETLFGDPRTTMR